MMCRRRPWSREDDSQLRFGSVWVKAERRMGHWGFVRSGIRRGNRYENIAGGVKETDGRYAEQGHG
jgi:hypothetical protein